MKTAKLVSIEPFDIHKIHMDYDENELDAESERTMGLLTAHYLLTDCPDVFGRAGHLECGEKEYAEGVVTALRYQWMPLVSTFIRVLSGRCIVMAQDIRTHSPSQGSAMLFDLPANDCGATQEWLWLPPGLAHGFFFPRDTRLQTIHTGKANADCSGRISPLSEATNWSKADPDLLRLFDAYRFGEKGIISAEDRAGFQHEPWRKPMAVTENFRQSFSKMVEDAGGNVARFSVIETGIPENIRREMAKAFSYNAVAKALSGDPCAVNVEEIDREREYLSCYPIREILFMKTGEAFFCCQSPGPRLAQDFSSTRKFSVDHFLSARQELEKALNSGEDCDCGSCPQLDRRKWGPMSDKVSNYILEPQSSVCNQSCIYCWYTPEYLAKCRDDYFPLIAHTDQLLSTDIFADNCTVSVSGGEPPIVPGFNEIIEFLTKNFPGIITMPTNMSVYSPLLEPLLENGRALLTVSPDAGARELFKIIKRRDFFDQVMENLGKYVKINPSAVHSKYNFMPENMEREQYVTYLRQMQRLGIENIIMSVDFKFRGPDDIADKMLEGMGNFLYEANRMGFRVNSYYHQIVMVFEGRNPLRDIFNAYRSNLGEFGQVPALAKEKKGHGRLWSIIRANNKGLWVNGWAYDKEKERKAQDVVVFWRDKPLFAGVPRFMVPKIRRKVESEFSFNSPDSAVGDEVLANPEDITAYARFDDEWFQLYSIDEKAWQ